MFVLLKPVPGLSKEEILKLLRLNKGVNIGKYPSEQDEVLIALKEKGYIREVNIAYSFTEEGGKATQEFINEYSNIIKDLTERHGESVKTHLKIVEETGLPDIVVQELAYYQGIKLIP